MWFEIIPAFLIISAAVAAPHGLAYILNYLVVGNLYRRSMDTYGLRLQYLRDRRLTGDPYKLRGLETLPEAEPGEDGGDKEEECGKENGGGGGMTEEECDEFFGNEEECEEE